VNENVWQAILDREKKAADGEKELDLEDDETDEELEEEDEREFVSDLSGEEDFSDLEDLAVSLDRTIIITASQHYIQDEDDEESDSERKSQRKRKASPPTDLKNKRRKGARVEVEYEDAESLPLTREALLQW
jgi:protein MAK16